MSDPSHEPFDGLASLYALGALSAREHAEFEEHLELCRACVDEAMAALPVTHQLVAAAPERSAPPALRTRVVTAVTGASPVTDVGDLALGTGPPPGKATAARPKGGVGRALLGLAAAACLVAAAGLGWYAAQQVNLARSLQENLDAANQRATLAELQARTAQQVAEEARQRAVILAASDLAADSARRATRGARRQRPGVLEPDHRRHLHRGRPAGAPGRACVPAVVRAGREPGERRSADGR